MFKWLKNVGRAADSAVVSTMAVNCWRQCFNESSTTFKGNRHASPFFWGGVASSFVSKWRQVHPASKDPQEILEQRCQAYMEWFQENIHMRIVGGEFSHAEAERIGEFIAVGVTRGIEEAILLDAERASLVHDLLPAEWLEGAGLSPEQFDEWYFKTTGKRRVHRSSEL
jgi:hypothetical protein